MAVTMKPMVFGAILDCATKMSANSRECLILVMLRMDEHYRPLVELDDLCGVCRYIRQARNTHLIEESLPNPGRQNIFKDSIHQRKATYDKPSSQGLRQEVPSR